MKFLLLIPGLCFTLVFSQETDLDPSIFDGTGKEVEKAEPPQASSEGESTDAGPAPEPQSETSPVMEREPEEALEEEPREIRLPAGTETEEELDTEDVGIPAAPGGQKSRAGETVNSTEKIAPGQAVDFPWDM